MKLGNLTRQGEALQKVIYKYGCITVAQLEHFLLPGTHIEEGLAKRICNTLKLKNLIQFTSDIAYPVRCEKYDQGMIDSIWVMLNLFASGNEESVYEKALNSFKADSPCSLCFIKDGSHIIKTIPVYTDSQLSLITYEQEKFYSGTHVAAGKESSANHTFIIIIRDKSMLVEIGKLGLTLPHKIAYLENDMDAQPVIKYFGNGNA